MEIKSKDKLPFLFKNCTEGFISENPFMFTDKSSSFKQSLTEQQFNKLSEFNVNKVVEVSAPESNAVDEKASSEDDNALAEINLLERQAAKMIKNSNAQKKLLKRISELKAAKGKK
jgi:hypothetical protein